MSTFRDVIARMAVDAEFARHARAHPDEVARSYDLSADEVDKLRGLADAAAGAGPMPLGARLSKSGIGSGVLGTLATGVTPLAPAEPEVQQPVLTEPEPQQLVATEPEVQQLVVTEPEVQELVVHDPPAKRLVVTDPVKELVTTDPTKQLVVGDPGFTPDPPPLTVHPSNFLLDPFGDDEAPAHPPANMPHDSSTPQDPHADDPLSPQPMTPPSPVPPGPLTPGPLAPGPLTPTGPLTPPDPIGTPAGAAVAAGSGAPIEAGLGNAAIAAAGLAAGAVAGGVAGALAATSLTADKAEET